MKFLYGVLLALGLFSCGSHDDGDDNNNPTPKGQQPHYNQSEVVIVGKATIVVTVGQSPYELTATPVPQVQTEGVTVTMGANTQFSINTTGFLTPTLTNGVISFGNITVSQASTNNLKLCGTGGNTKCTHALFQVYTTGVSGSGFWNTTDGYGAPMTAGLAGSLATVVLGQTNAITVESVALPGARNTVTLADFVPAPVFLFSGDFTDSGVGTYTTTIDVVFALAP